MDAPHPLAGPVFTEPKKPTECTLCHKRGQWVREINAGITECSHVDCPLRRSVTAQPRAEQ